MISISLCNMRLGSLDNQRNSVENPIVHVRSKLCGDANGVNLKETHYKKMLGSLGYISAAPPDMIFVFVVSLIHWSFHVTTNLCISKLPKGSS